MKPLPLPHKVLLCIHGLIALAFYLYLSDYGQPDFWFIGWDELQHKEQALQLAERNPVYSFFFGETLAGSIAYGNAYLIMLSTVLLGSVEAYLLLKFLLLSVSTMCLYSLLRQHRGALFASNATLLYLLYLPLRVFEVSVLKDDALVSLIVICVYLMVTRKYVLALLVGFLILTFRVNAFPMPVIFYMFLKRQRLGHLALGLVAMAAVAAAVPGAANQIALMIQLMSEKHYGFLFLATKYFFGPLPWNLAEYDTEYTFFGPWFGMTLLTISALILHRKTWASIRRNITYIVLMMGCALLPYLVWTAILDTVGPRQFAMAGFFYALMIFEWAFYWKFALVGSARRTAPRPLSGGADGSGALTASGGLRS